MFDFQLISLDPITYYEEIDILSLHNLQELVQYGQELVATSMYLIGMGFQQVDRALPS